MRTDNARQPFHLPDPFCHVHRADVRRSGKGTLSVYTDRDGSAVYLTFYCHSSEQQQRRQAWDMAEQDRKFCFRLRRKLPGGTVQNCNCHRRTGREGSRKQFAEEFPASSLFRFHLCYYYRRVRPDRRNSGFVLLPLAFLQGGHDCKAQHPDFSCIPRIRTYPQHSIAGSYQYGSRRKPAAGNGPAPATGKHGGIFTCLYVHCPWNNPECEQWDPETIRYPETRS
jgi:hypothetical protein